jgi:hypothetical protein
MFTRNGFLLASVIAAVFVVAPQAAAQEGIDSAAAFARLKTLAGTWEVTDKATGRTSTWTYEMTGRGTTLIEGAGGMMTAYHLDKGTLVLTHFCGAGNQPRMRIKSVTDGGKRISFEMYDITNLATPDSYYTNSLDVVLLSDDRVELAYGGTTAGRKSTQTFALTRKSSSR